MTTDAIVQFCKDIIITLGGTSVLIVVIAKFLKSRFEKYFDTQIELKSSEALKVFESNLEKKKIYYEKKISKEMESIDFLVNFYTRVAPLVISIDDTISEMIKCDYPTSSIVSISESISSLQMIITDVKQNCVVPKIYLDKKVFRTYSLFLNELDKSISLYYSGINTYDLPADKRNELNNSIKSAKRNMDDSIKLLRDSIDKKAK